MKLVKSLLLGSAAGLLAVAGAQAADLPARKAAPVEYVRVCDAYGGGFFYLPGIAGDVCLRVGGRLRFEAVFMNAQNALSVTGIGTAAPGLALIPRKGQDQYGFRTQGQVNLDVRKQTDFGTARAFVSFYIRRNSGVLNTGVGGGTAIPTGAVSTGYLGVGRADSVPSLNSAYIQFAGVTAGFTGSFFNFYADAYNYEGMLTADFTSNLLAYTATFGNGFSASISLEDKGAHQAGTGGLSSNFGSGAFLQHGSASASPVQRTPYLVANVRVDQAWGSAQIAGMIQQINTVATAGNAALLPANVLPLAAVQPGGPAVPAAYTGPASASKFGFGIMAGAEFNLPMIGAGDQLWLQAAYANGALDALGIPSDGNLNGGFTRLLGGFQRADRDAIAVANTTAAGVVTGYSLEREKGYNLAADFLHFWSPQLFSNFAATYTRINPGTVTRNTAWYLGGLGTGSEYRLQASLVWRPTPGLDIGLEVTYARLRQTLAQNTGSGVFTPLPAGIPLNPQALEGRLRLQRDF